jgi:hypothetical protein
MSITLSREMAAEESLKIFLHISVVRNAVTCGNVKKHLTEAWTLKIPGSFNIK